MRARSMRLRSGFVASALLVAGVWSTGGVSGASQLALGSHRLVLRDDDTNQLLGNAAARELLKNVHDLLSAGQTNAVVRLIPKPYKQRERALLKRSKWRNRALVLLSTHLNADAPDVVYPGFVHRCTSHSDYSKYDVADLKALGRTVNHAKPCKTVWNYHGAVLVVSYVTKPGPRHGRPYFRGLILSNR